MPRLDKRAKPDGTCKVLVHGQWCGNPVPGDYSHAMICQEHREQERRSLLADVNRGKAARRGRDAPPDER